MRAAVASFRAIPPLSVLALAAILGVTIAHAAGLTLTSGGVVLKTRTYGSAVTCTLTAVADTYVNEGQPNSSFGSQTSLEISSSSSAARRVLVGFDLASCSPQIAADAIIHSATVRLTTASGMGLSSRSYELHRATSSWTESTTWSTQPSVAASATSTVTIPGLTGSGTTIQWPAARDVQAFVAQEESNLGWRLKDTSEDSGLLPPSITFDSREVASDQPELVITYAP